jgi:PKD repeat protein
VGGNRARKVSGTRRRGLTRIGVLALLVSTGAAAINAAPARAIFPCPNPDVPPVASFTYSPSSPQVGEAVAFDATTSSDGRIWIGIPEFQCDPYPEPITEYGWDWSDPTPPGSGPTPTHTFALAGDYTVTLTVTTSFAGLSDSESKLVTVVPIPQPLQQIKPQPQPQFTRTLGIGYSDKKDRFSGKLTSESPACTSSQKVSVFKKRKGNDPKLGSATTNASGKYSLTKKKAGGNFYAKIDQSSSSGGTCLAAQSKTLKVG